MLELKDATLTLEGRELFRGLSLMALDGQLTCITGRAGVGKTAIIQVMLGFVLLDDGLVSIDGELLTPLSAPVFRKMMAYVPQKREVNIRPAEYETTGLETLWAPYNVRHYQLTAIDEHLDIAPLAQKRIIIADDPDTAMLSVLTSMAAGGHTVIVTSEREEYLNLADRVVEIERLRE